MLNIENLEKYAKKKGLKKLWLTSTPAARKFYKKKGYKIIGPYEYKIRGISFPETKMEKVLK